jgi:hypothetical protein
MLPGFEDENKIRAVQKYLNPNAGRVTGITFVHERCQVEKKSMPGYYQRALFRRIK